MKILDRFDKLIGRFCRRNMVAFTKFIKLTECFRGWNMVVFTKFIKLTERFCRRNPVVYTNLTCQRAEYGRADAVHLSTIGGMKFRKALIIFL